MVSVKVFCHYLKRPEDVRFITFQVLGKMRGQKKIAFGDEIEAAEWKEDFDRAVRSQTKPMLKGMRLTSCEASSDPFLEQYVPFHGSPEELINQANAHVIEIVQVP